ncbi:MAG: diadenylate cyclase CdaA [Oscillospiraceae bacterium]|jgi:diadenylate cyclase|nr:diadenylate cyclase CdaA [Oscillospiraceae bacterium]
MEVLLQWFHTIWNYVLTIKITDFIDIAVIAFLVYHLMKLIRRTSSAQVAKGIFLLLAALWVSSLLQLNVVRFILSKAVEMGFLALIILFQPELRRALEKVGRSTLGGVFTQTVPNSLENTISHTVTACIALSKAREGALIVFERKNLLEGAIKTGTVLDASVSSELLKNIFYPKAPMHDGAAIVREGRIAGAGCMLPLSGNVHLSRELGMRHRAGIGVSESSDAVAVIVSEETGSISVAVGGILKRHLSPETLERLLRNELLPAEPGEKRVGGLKKFDPKNLFKRKRDAKQDDQ